MASFGTITTYAGPTGGGNNESFAHTVDAGATGLVVAVGRAYNTTTGTFTGVTWTPTSTGVAEPLTQMFVSLPNNNYGFYYYHLPNPTPGAGDITTLKSGVRANVVAYSVMDGDSASPIRGTPQGTTFATGTTWAGTATGLTVGDMLLVSLQRSYNTSITVAPTDPVNDTELVDFVGSNGTRSASYSKAIDAATEGWSWTNGSNTSGMVVTAAIADGGGAPPAPNLAVLRRRRRKRHA